MNRIYEQVGRLPGNGNTNDMYCRSFRNIMRKDTMEILTDTGYIVEKEEGLEKLLHITKHWKQWFAMIIPFSSDKIHNN